MLILVKGTPNLDAHTLPLRNPRSSGSLVSDIVPANRSQKEQEPPNRASKKDLPRPLRIGPRFGKVDDVRESSKLQLW